MKTFISAVVLTGLVSGHATAFEPFVLDQPNSSTNTVLAVNFKGFANIDNKSAPSELEPAYDNLMAAATLAGIANRESGRVFLLTGGRQQHLLNFVLSQPTPWQNSTVREVTTDQLIQEMRTQVRGLIVWDPNVPSTSNVAIAVAGAEDAIPVRYDTKPTSLYSRLRNSGWPVLTSFVNNDGSSMFTGRGRIPGTNRPSSKSSKCDAYLWLTEKYVRPGRAGRQALAVFPDAYDFFTNRNNRRIGVIGSGLAEVARVVEQRGIVIDFQPLDSLPPKDDPNQPKGTDYKTMCEVLGAANTNRNGRLVEVGGFVAWEKYTRNQEIAVNMEWKTQGILSSFNCYVGVGAVNASFLSRDDMHTQYSQNFPSERKLRSRGFVDNSGRVRRGRLFIAFYAGDYDGGWIEKLWSAWDNPRRGSVPITWAINPNLAQTNPRVYNYFRVTATDNDFFMMGNSGAGYVIPRNLEETRPHSFLPSALDQWLAHCSKWKAVSDSRSCWIIDGTSGKLSRNGLRKYAKVFDKGLLTQMDYGVDMVDGVPVLQIDPGYLGVGTEVRDAARNLAGRRIPPGKSTFLPVRTILWNAAKHEELAIALKRRNAQVEIVDVYSLLLLKKLAHENGYAR